MREKKIGTFIIVMAVLCSLFLLGFIYRPGGSQRSVFFHGANECMADYYNVAKYSALRNPYCYGEEDPTPEEHAYPPLAYMISYVLSRFSDYVNLPAAAAWGSPTGLLSSFFFVFFGAFLLAMLLYDANKNSKTARSIVTLLFVFSGIFLFSLERGNLIFVTAFCTSFFVLNYENENRYVRELSYIALAVAAGLKAYPALLGVLLLFDRQYKRALRLMIYGIIVFFVPFLFFKGGFHNLPILLHNLQLNSEKYTKLVFTRFNFRFWAQQIDVRKLRRLVYHYFPYIDGVLSVAAVALAVFQKTRWKKMMLLLLTLVILPVNSAEYTGLYLLVGVVLFLNEGTAGKLDWLYLALMILFLNPFQVIVRGVNLTQYGINLSVSLMFVVLLADSVVGSLKSGRAKRIAKTA